MNVRYIQHGNRKQCDKNGVAGWEFAFAQQTPETRLNYGTGNRRWFSVSGNGETATWNITPEYATTFRLELKYEQKFNPDDIPF